MPKKERKKKKKYYTADEAPWWCRDMTKRCTIFFLLNGKNVKEKVNIKGHLQAPKAQ